MSQTAELLRVGAGAGAAGRVENIRPLHAGSVDQREEIASDSARLGSDNSEHGVGRDGGINRVSPGCDHRHRRLGR
jgi:hypothetical protein